MFLKRSRFLNIFVFCILSLISRWVFAHNESTQELKRLFYCNHGEGGVARGVEHLHRIIDGEVFPEDNDDYELFYKKDGDQFKLIVRFEFDFDEDALDEIEKIGGDGIENLVDDYKEVVEAIDFSLHESVYGDVVSDDVDCEVDEDDDNEVTCTVMLENNEFPYEESYPVRFRGVEEVVTKDDWKRGCTWRSPWLDLKEAEEKTDGDDGGDEDPPGPGDGGGSGGNGGGTTGGGTASGGDGNGGGGGEGAQCPETCDVGEICNPETGQCELVPRSLCEEVVCEEGYQCAEDTGECVVIEASPGTGDEKGQKTDESKKTDPILCLSDISQCENTKGWCHLNPKSKVSFSGWILLLLPLLTKLFYKALSR